MKLICGKSPVAARKFTHIYLGIAGWLFFGMPLLGQNSATTILSKVGEWPGHARGMPRAICVTNGLAYVAAYPGSLLLFDVSNHSKPVCVGSVGTLGAYDNIAVSGNYAYVAAEYTGFRVIDVSNPTKPKLVCNYDVRGRFHGFAVSGRYAYMGKQSGGPSLCVIDVSNPSNCVQVVEHRGLGIVSGIHVAGNQLFVAAGQSLNVFDVSKPGLLGNVGRCEISQFALTVTMLGNVAYVVDGNANLISIDMSDPRSPVPLGRCAITANLSGPRGKRIIVSGKYAYAGGRGQTIDVSDPKNLVCVGRYATNGIVDDLAVEGNYAYVAGMNGLEVVDISNPTNSVIAASYKTAGHTAEVAVAGNYAYLADGQEGLKIVDISDPTRCQYMGGVGIVDRFRTDVGSGYIQRLAVAGKYAYLVDSSSGLEIIDVSNPAKPSRAGSHPSRHPLGLAVKGNYACLLDGDLPPTRGPLEVNLNIIDVRNPAKCTLLSRTRCQAENIDLAGNYAYATGFGEGLQIFDVRQPSRPVKVGQYKTNGGARKSAVKGNYAFMADGTNGLQVIDVSQPAKPSLAGGFKTGGRGDAVAVAGHYAFMADGPLGLQVFDVSNPSQPVHAGLYDTSADAIGVTVAGSCVYVAAGFNGLQIFKITSSDSNK